MEGTNLSLLRRLKSAFPDSSEEWIPFGTTQSICRPVHLPTIQSTCPFLAPSTLSPPFLPFIPPKPPTTITLIQPSYKWYNWRRSQQRMHLVLAALQFDAQMGRGFKEGSYAANQPRYGIHALHSHLTCQAGNQSARLEWPAV